MICDSVHSSGSESCNKNFYKYQPATVCIPSHPLYSVVSTMQQQWQGPQPMAGRRKLGEHLNPLKLYGSSFTSSTSKTYLALYPLPKAAGKKKKIKVSKTYNTTLFAPSHLRYYSTGAKRLVYGRSDERPNFTLAMVVCGSICLGWIYIEGMSRQ